MRMCNIRRFQSSLGPGVSMSSIGFMNHKVTVPSNMYSCRQGAKDINVPYESQDPVQIRGECFNFPSLWGMPEMILPRTIAAIRAIILSPRVITDGRWPAGQLLYSNMYQGKIPSFQNSPRESHPPFVTLQCLFYPVLSPQYPFSSFHTLQKKLRVLLKWNKKLLNQDLHLLPPQKRWAFVKRNVPREVVMLVSNHS